MVGYLQPLAHNFAIVNELGYPTEYFIRWAQQKQIDIGESVDEGRALEIVKTFLTEHPLQAGSGIDLTPDGDLNNSPTISAKAQEILDQITDVRGSVLFRGVDTWKALSPGISGYVLSTNGPSADPSWVAQSGGGGGGSSIYYDSLARDVGAASGQPFATKGISFLALGDFSIEGIVVISTWVAGATYSARVYEINGTTASSTIISVLDDGLPTTVAANSTLVARRFDLSNSVTFSRDKRYAVCLSRTDSTGTYVLPLGSATSGTLYSSVFPAAFDSGRVQIPLTNPVATSTLSGNTTGGWFNVGFIGDRASIT